MKEETSSTIKNVDMNINIGFRNVFLIMIYLFAICNTLSAPSWMVKDGTKIQVVINNSNSSAISAPQSHLEPKIPHRFVFNSYKDYWNVDVNDLEKPNDRIIHRLLRRTVVMFKKVWEAKGYTNSSMSDAIGVDFMNEPIDDIEVVFLTDKECEELIKNMGPQMLEPFQKEKSGRFKSDICRIFSLYDGGGYYLDTDLLVHEAPYLEPHVSFASIIEKDFQDKFHQAFVAVAPKHPIIQEAINVMMEHYVTKKGIVNGPNLGYRSHNNMGTWTLREAHKRVMRRFPQMANEIVLLQELNLDDYPKWFPEIDRPPKSNKRGQNRLRFAAVNLAAHKLHFWSKGYKNGHLTKAYRLGDPEGFKFVPKSERNTTATE